MIWIYLTIFTIVGLIPYFGWRKHKSTKEYKRDKSNEQILDEYSAQLIERFKKFKWKGSEMEVIHPSRPCVVRWRNALTDQSCDELLKTAQTAPSSAWQAGTITGNKVNRKFRHCDLINMVVPSLSHELAKLFNVRRSQTKEFRILKYGKNGFIGAHRDALFGSSLNLETDPQRLCTGVFYLNDVPEDAGGGLRFNDIGVTIQPRKGDLIVFLNVALIDGAYIYDEHSTHEGLPIVAEDLEKFAMQVFICDLKSSEKQGLRFKIFG